MQTKKKKRKTQNVLIENVRLLSNRKFQIFHKNVITAIPAKATEDREDSSSSRATATATTIATRWQRQQQEQQNVN